jgi:GDPmannose 4,6-dehydratase
VTRKRALITGITGQDGSYLAELLLEKGYEVHGIIRRASTFNTSRLDHLYHDQHEAGLPLTLHYGDLTDGARIASLVYSLRPDEIYNLGAQSHVKVSFDMPEFTTEVDALGTVRLLEVIRSASELWDIRYYQAGSSEMFGRVVETPQRETTPFAPQSPYAAAKVFAHHMTALYRESYGLFATNGILFNHESPRRGETFVTRKITRGVAAILARKQAKLYLGNLDAKRDWGYAREYVEAMWRMLQHHEPGDFVIATGEQVTVREFVEKCFSLVGLDWTNHVEIDPRYFRPAEVDTLLGDPSKAAATLGWTAKTKWQDLARIMLSNDLRQAGIDLRHYPELDAIPPDRPVSNIISIFAQESAA